jgi:hypothetical protein
MFKMERMKSILIGSGFLSLVLFIKGLYSGEFAVILSFFLVLIFVVGPEIISYKLKQTNMNR